MGSEVHGEPANATLGHDEAKASSVGASSREGSRSPLWTYDDAFSRNLGLITRAEQARLRERRVAIAGLGGVGGIDLVALARLGIGKFTIADPDRFETRNTNRQYGAMRSSEGRYKAEVMRDIVLDINPEADVRVFREALGPSNAHAFLQDADVLVDGIDAFEIDLRRTLFRMARERGMHALGAGPVGFSTVWVIFDPQGMPFDRYFDLNDGMNPIEKFVAYVVGMAPSALQRRYMDLEHLDVKNHVGPSAGLACHLASGVVAAEVLKILLGRGRIQAAPVYHQFDPYVGRYVRKRLRGGNRNPLQKAKRRWLLRYLARRGASR
jgi:molybdopterin/thiamine biosynthesis adenylyltransferase